MAHAPAIPPSKLWRNSRRKPAPLRTTSAATQATLAATRLTRLLLLPLILAALSASACAFAGAGPGETPAKRSILLLPVRSHWTSAPLAEAITHALPEALTSEGFAVTALTSDSLTFKRGVSEGWLKPDDLTNDRVELVRHNLALVFGCQASLAAEVVVRESETVLRGELAGAVSHRQVTVEVSVPAGTGNPGGLSRDQIVQNLVRGLAGKLTPEEAWAQAGADEAGRQAGAPDRFAAGEAAKAEQRFQDATLEFAAALAGQPDNPDYLMAAAETDAALGRAADALLLWKRLSDLRPNDRGLLVQLGDAALMAKRPEQAEAAFKQAASAQPPDPQAIEGLGRAARAQGQRDRAQGYYEQLMSTLPALAGAPKWLPSLLATQRDDSVRLATSGPGLDLALGRIYLRNGHYPEGVQALLAYQTPDRPPYSDADYLAIASDLDNESETVARRVAAIITRPLAELTGDALDEELRTMHDRSDGLSDLAEGMKASEKLDPAHRYRVLAYNLLNQSNFESLMYFQTHDPDRRRRADLLRDAFRKARTQAQDLSRDLARGAR